MKLDNFPIFFHASFLDGWFLLKVLSCQRRRSTTRTEASKSEPKTKTVKEGRSQSVGREGKVGLMLALWNFHRFFLVMRFMGFKISFFFFRGFLWFFDIFCGVSFSMFPQSFFNRNFVPFSTRPGQAEEVWSGMLQDLWRFATEIIEINMFDMDESAQKNSTASLDLLSSKVSEYQELRRKYLTLNFRGCLSCSARNFLKWRNSAGIRTCSARLVIVGVVGLWAMPNSTRTVWESFYARKDVLLADAAITEIERRNSSKMFGRTELFHRPKLTHCLVEVTLVLRHW